MTRPAIQPATIPPPDPPALPTRQPWLRGEIIILTTVMLINIVDGLDYQLLSLSIGAIAADWGAAPASFSGAVSAGFLGAALGTPVGGWLGDRYGRKPAILFGMLTFGIMTFAMAWCTNTSQLTGARLLSGIGLGACLPPMLALAIESVTPDKRGSAIAFTMVSMPLGITLSGIVIPRLNGSIGWQASIMSCGGAVFVVALLALFTLPKAAPKPAAGPADDMPATLRQRLATLRAAVDLSTIAALMGAIFLVYIAMSAALSWLPAFALGHDIAAVTAGQAISIWSLCGMAGTLAAGRIVNRLGGMRAARLILGGFAAAALLSAVLLTLTGASAAALYAAASLAGLFASAAITVLYAAAAERFPQAVRANGMAAVTLAGKAGGIAGGGSGGIMLALPSLAGFFAALGGIALAAWLCVQGGRRPAETTQEESGTAPV